MLFKNVFSARHVSTIKKLIQTWMLTNKKAIFWNLDWFIKFWHDKKKRLLIMALLMPSNLRAPLKSHKRFDSLYQAKSKRSQTDKTLLQSFQYALSKVWFHCFCNICNNFYFLLPNLMVCHAPLWSRCSEKTCKIIIVDIPT